MKEMKPIAHGEGPHTDLQLQSTVTRFEVLFRNHSTMTKFPINMKIRNAITYTLHTALPPPT